MAKYKTSMQRSLIAAALCANVFVANAALAATAPNYSFNFDGVAAGTVANAAIGAAYPDVSFANAVFAPDQDSYGRDIPGTARWRPDTSWMTPPVTVDNPLTFFRGAAPSGTNALNALWQPVLMQFSSPLQLASFSVTQDRSTYGLPGGAQLLFLDVSGAVLKNVGVDQTVPGLTISSGPVSGGVSAVLLPSGKFYDDINAITVSAVPEASTWAMFAGGLLLVGYAARRRSA